MNPITINLDAIDYVYYSESLDELFTLPVKPDRPTRIYQLWFEDSMVLDDVVYLGEL